MVPINLQGPLGSREVIFKATCGIPRERGISLAYLTARSSVTLKGREAREPVLKNPGSSKEAHRERRSSVSLKTNSSRAI